MMQNVAASIASNLAACKKEETAAAAAAGPD